MNVHRERSYACIHPETYKYYFAKHDVFAVWRRLSAAYGDITTNHAFGTMQVNSDRFLFRAIVGGNPITVIRKRRCTADDVERLHRLFGFDCAEDGEQASARVAS